MSLIVVYIQDKKNSPAIGRVSNWSSGQERVHLVTFSSYEHLSTVILTTLLFWFTSNAYTNCYY